MAHGQVLIFEMLSEMNRPPSVRQGRANLKEFNSEKMPVSSRTTGDSAEASSSDEEKDDDQDDLFNKLEWNQSDLEKIFVEIDFDQRGFWDVRHLHEALVKMDILEKNHKNFIGAQIAMREIDVNKNGEISMEEFTNFFAFKDLEKYKHQLHKDIQVNKHNFHDVITNLDIGAQTKVTYYVLETSQDKVNLQVMFPKQDITDSADNLEKLSKAIAPSKVGHTRLRWLDVFGSDDKWVAACSNIAKLEPLPEALQDILGVDSLQDQDERLFFLQHVKVQLFPGLKAEDVKRAADETEAANHTHLRSSRTPKSARDSANNQVLSINTKFPDSFPASGQSNNHSAAHNETKTYFATDLPELSLRSNFPPETTNLFACDDLTPTNRPRSRSLPEDFASNRGEVRCEVGDKPVFIPSDKFGGNHPSLSRQPSSRPSHFALHGAVGMF